MLKKKYRILVILFLGLSHNYTVDAAESFKIEEIEEQPLSKKISAWGRPLYNKATDLSSSIVNYARPYALEGFITGAGALGLYCALDQKNNFSPLVARLIQSSYGIFTTFGLYTLYKKYRKLAHERQQKELEEQTISDEKKQLNDSYHTLRNHVQLMLLADTNDQAYIADLRKDLEKLIMKYDSNRNPLSWNLEFLEGDEILSGNHLVQKTILDTFVLPKNIILSINEDGDYIVAKVPSNNYHGKNIGDILRSIFSPEKKEFIFSEGLINQMNNSPENSDITSLERRNIKKNERVTYE